MDRREEQRVEIELPCKVWHPRAMKFVPGFTRDLSREGVQITLRAGAVFEPGERILIGLPSHVGAILRRSTDLIEGEVIRAGVEEGRVEVAVRFVGPYDAKSPPPTGYVAHALATRAS